MSIAIKVENLSKAYQLGEIGTGTISRDLERWVAKLRGKKDPFLKIGEANDRTIKGTSNTVWSLKDINFEINQGDAVGIIGRNGAGKSTLLKILSRVTSPTSGKISGKGRIASLLEVGTGFHPELTGRENIYLNGTILGMRKREIQKHFDAIVDFAGVQRYIDTPVKRYSSGMYVRLAFGVAAHLESEILIVDEVLAVGDAEFQRKCLGKMKDVRLNDGRTVLFVSHNIVSLKNLCSTGIVMDNGQIIYKSDINDSVKHYMSSNTVFTEHRNSKKFTSKVKEPYSIIELKAYQPDVHTDDFLTSSDTVCLIKIKFNVFELDKFVLGIVVYDEYDNQIFSTYFDDLGTFGQLNIVKDEVEFNCIIPKNFFNEGNYVFDIDLGLANIKRITNRDEHHLSLTFHNIDGVGTKYALGKNWRKSSLLPYLNWKIS